MSACGKCGVYEPVHVALSLNFSSAVSRDRSQLQLLAAWPVSRGGTTPNPCAMSAATEAVGNHVFYRTLGARRQRKGVSSRKKEDEGRGDLLEDEKIEGRRRK